MDILSTSGINKMLSDYSKYERSKQISHLETRKTRYRKLSSAWSTVDKNLKGLKSFLSEMKTSSGSSIFESRKTELSSDKFLSATASKNSPTGSFTLRVKQLAQNDTLVSKAMNANTNVSSLEGTHKFKISSGEYSSTVSVKLTGSETNDSIMDKIAQAVNSDKASITSSDIGSYTGQGELQFEVDGQKKSINYDYTNKSYSEVVGTLVNEINNNVKGVLAEKDGDGNLKITATSSDKVISISDLSGNLANSLGIVANKEKAASTIASASSFNLSTSSSKLSFSADKSGYDNRLIIENISGGALDHIGLTSAVLTGRAEGNDTDAGFMFKANSETDNGLNSKITFNGINVQRNENKFSDLVEGVTFDIKAVMKDTDPDVSVAVKNNVSEIKDKIKGFVDKFNESYSFVKGNYTSGDKGRGLLTGDSVAMSIMTNFRQIATQRFDGLGGSDIQSLRQIGIDFDPVSGLSIKEDSKLTTALNENIEEVATLFNSDEGVVKKMTSTLDKYLGLDGSVTGKTKSYRRNISYLSDKINSTNQRIDKSVDNLRKKYQALQRQYAEFLQSSSMFSSLGSMGGASGGFF